MNNGEMLKLCDERLPLKCKRGLGGKGKFLLKYRRVNIHWEILLIVCNKNKKHFSFGLFSAYTWAQYVTNWQDFSSEAVYMHLKAHNNVQQWCFSHLSFCNFNDLLSQNGHRFVILCIWIAGIHQRISANTGLWQLPNVSSAFKQTK